MFDVPQYLSIFRRRWWPIALCVVVALAAGLAATLLPARTYTASVSFFVSAQETGTTQSAYQGGLLSTQRATSYVELLGSDLVADQVSAMVGSLTPKQVQSEIQASGRTGSVIIDVAVVDEDPVRAAAVANAVATIFPGIVAELERPLGAAAAPSVAVRVVKPAAVPVDADPLQLVRNLSVALLAGLLLGGLSALLIDAADRTVRSADRLREELGVPCLGPVAQVEPSALHAMAVLDAPGSLLAETFRQIRTAVSFIEVDKARRLFLITSSVAGEGKTTTVCNLAGALGAAGHRVLVIDADLRLPQVAASLGVEPEVGLTTVLARQTELGEAIQTVGRAGARIDVLASGALPPNPAELLASARMQEVLSQAGRQYDYVLVDGPPVLPVTDAVALAPMVDAVVLAVRYGRTALSDVRHAEQTLVNSHVALSAGVLTMAPRKVVAPAGGYGGYGEGNIGARTVAPRAVSAAAAAFDTSASEPRATGSRHALPTPYARSES